MKFALVLLLALIGGCGGGGGEPESSGEPTPVVQPTPQQPDPVAQPIPIPPIPVEPSPTQPEPEPVACANPKTIKIQLFGDSTQDGYIAGGGRAVNYPALVLQTAMDAKFGTGQVTVESRARNGTTTKHLLEGTDGLNKPWPQSVDADIVVDNHGINDRGGYKFTADYYKENLRKLAVAPAMVVFQTPLPTWSAQFLPAYLDQSFAPEMREVATELGIPIIDTNAYANSIPTWNGEFAPDSVHPNDKGYLALGNEVVAPALIPLVEKLRCP